MLSINSPRPGCVIQAFGGREYEGICFEVVRQQGLSVILKASCSDQEAKAVCKRVMSQLPDLKRMVCSCQIVDEKGNLV